MSKKPPRQPAVPAATAQGQDAPAGSAPTPATHDDQAADQAANAPVVVDLDFSSDGWQWAEALADGLPDLPTHPHWHRPTDTPSCLLAAMDALGRARSVADLDAARNLAANATASPDGLAPQA